MQDDLRLDDLGLGLGDEAPMDMLPLEEDQEEPAALAGPEPPEEEADAGRDTGKAQPDLERIRAELEDQKRRNAGLQRRLQRELQARQELERQLAQYEEALYQQQLAGLPPEERVARMQVFRREREIRERERQAQLIDQSLEQRARALVIAELSRRYKVPASDLERFNDPDSMEFYAQRVAQLRAQQRRRAEANRFEPAEAPPAPSKKPQDLSEAAELFKQIAARRLGQL